MGEKSRKKIGGIRTKNTCTQAVNEPRMPKEISNERCGNVL